MPPEISPIKDILGGVIRLPSQGVAVHLKGNASILRRRIPRVPLRL